jgi:hypothetical protein
VLKTSRASVPRAVAYDRATGTTGQWGHGHTVIRTNSATGQIRQSSHQDQCPARSSVVPAACPLSLQTITNLVQNSLQIRGEIPGSRFPGIMLRGVTGPFDEPLVHISHPYVKGAGVVTEAVRGFPLAYAPSATVAWSLGASWWDLIRSPPGFLLQAFLVLICCVEV